jgi:hypothetical protein
MVVRLIKKCSILPVVCLSLACFGSGCDNSSVNESGSPAASGSATAAPAKDAPPPPKSIKDYYEQQKANAPASKKATPTTKGESK